MATHAVQTQGHRPWLTAVGTIALVILLAGVAFAAGRNTAPTQTAATAGHSVPSQVGSMMPWIRHHSEDVAWMRANVRTVAWMQTHPQQWQWMRSHMGDIGWMRDHMGKYDEWRSGMSGTSGDHMMDGSHSGSGWHW